MTNKEHGTERTRTKERPTVKSEREKMDAKQSYSSRTIQSNHPVSQCTRLWRGCCFSLCTHFRWQRHYSITAPRFIHSQIEIGKCAATPPNSWTWNGIITFCLERFVATHWINSVSIHRKSFAEYKCVVFRARSCCLVNFGCCVVASCFFFF